MPPATESTTTRTLTSDEKVLLWSALISHASDPAHADDAVGARALRELLTHADITVTPYES
jgi:hypothetical protein